jgi:DNA-binding MarR family transcriptional regulator
MSTETASIEAVLLASLTHLMARWSATSTQAAVAAEAHVEVDPIDIAPLYMLGLRGASRAGDLAASLHVTRPTMSKQLARLERAGLIDRDADPDDRRGTVIRLSPAGALAHQRLVGRGVEMMHGAIADWSGDEAARFSVQFGRFVEALGGHTESSEREPAAGDERPNPGSRNGGQP